MPNLMLWEPPAWAVIGSLVAIVGLIVYIIATETERAINPTPIEPGLPSRKTVFWVTFAIAFGTALVLGIIGAFPL